MFRIIIFALLLFFSTNVNYAQGLPISTEQAREQLKAKGLTEDEVAARLRQRGIDIDNIDTTNPNELLRLEATLKEVIAELEQEKMNAENAASNTDTTPSTTVDPAEEKRAENIVEKETIEAARSAGEDIEEAVKQGASVEEAISEQLTEQIQEKLPPSNIYGQQVFRNKSIKLYNQSDNVRPPNSYILGVGDELKVVFWGLSQGDFSYTVQEGGYIKPSDMERITVGGITLEKARDLIRSRFARYYRFRPDEFEVTVGYVRTINVNIVGEVINSGSYRIPAINTAFNALVASGGPSDIGSVRNIQLIRAGKPAVKLDVYEFLKDPNVQQSYYLQDNDFINVPIAERLVTINGAVRRPFTYELIQGEQLNKLIEYAGGLKDNAYNGNIQITRYENDEQVILDVNLGQLKSQGGDFTLQSGDVVQIKNIARPYENFVEIDGSVELPGKYQLRAGMRINDLLNRGILLEESRTDLAFLLRTNADRTTNLIRVDLNDAINNQTGTNNVQLQPEDRLIIYSQARYTDRATIGVSGAVRNPIEDYAFPTEQEFKVEDAILLAGGLKPEASDLAYITRINPANRKEVQYLRINLRNAIGDPSSPDNVQLEPFDQLRVLSSLTYTDESTVGVSGAVRNAGDYKYDESLTLTDVLTLAGGLKIQAATNKIDIFRLQIQDNQPTETVIATVSVDESLQINGGDADFKLAPFDRIVVRSVPEFEFQQIMTVQGEVQYPGAQALTGDNTRISTILEQAGGLSNEAFPAGATLFRPTDGVGYIVINLNEVIKNKLSPSNLVLKAGDILNIPKRQDLVTIKLDATEASELYPDKMLNAGKVNTIYKPGKNAKWYVEEYAAGVGEKGKSSRITVEHPNGEIDQTKNFLVFKSYPEVREGSVITVGRKPVKTEEERRKKEDVEWTRIVADSLAQVTAILSVVLLIQRL